MKKKRRWGSHYIQRRWQRQDEKRFAKLDAIRRIEDYDDREPWYYRVAEFVGRPVRWLNVPYWLRVPLFFFTAGLTVVTAAAYLFVYLT